MDKLNNPKVYFDLTIEEEAVGRLVIELRKDVVPRTAENFRVLCTGEKGVGRAGRPLHYKGSSFHRTLDFMCQGGDFTHGDGQGGESSYGFRFPDENFELKFTDKGMVAMANGGPNTNGSQFFITMRATPWLDEKHVVFGNVVDGFAVLDKIEAVATLSGKPARRITVADCGEVLPIDTTTPLDAKLPECEGDSAAKRQRVDIAGEEIGDNEVAATAAENATPLEAAATATENATTLEPAATAAEDATTIEAAATAAENAATIEAGATVAENATTLGDSGCAVAAGDGAGVQ